MGRKQSRWSFGCWEANEHTLLYAQVYPPWKLMMVRLETHDNALFVPEVATCLGTHIYLSIWDWDMLPCSYSEVGRVLFFLLCHAQKEVECFWHQSKNGRLDFNRDSCNSHFSIAYLSSSPSLIASLAGNQKLPDTLITIHPSPFSPCEFRDIKAGWNCRNIQ